MLVDSSILRGHLRKTRSKKKEKRVLSHCVFPVALTSVGPPDERGPAALQAVQHGVVEVSPGPGRGQLGQLRSHVGVVGAGVGPAQGPGQAVLVAVAVAGALPRGPAVDGRAGRVVEAAGRPGAVGRTLRGGLRPHGVAGHGLRVGQAGDHGAHPGAGHVHRGVGVGVHVGPGRRLVSRLALRRRQGQGLVHVPGVHQQPCGLVHLQLAALVQVRKERQLLGQTAAAAVVSEVNVGV